MNYGDALREGFHHALTNDEKVLVIGQGLWSPWYVGNTMTNLDVIFGRNRIVDTPVSELACTGAGIGMALAGYRPVVTNPRVDFALLAVDQIVNQAAKWNSMFGGNSPVPVVFRLIVNRGGEQGAQHSQSLYSWFSHIPGLRVVVPATPKDAAELLVASIQCDDPVVFIDDRWLYDWDLGEFSIDSIDLADQKARLVRKGTDITLVGLSWTTRLLLDAATSLESKGISASVVDLRVVNPLDTTAVNEDLLETGRLLVAEGDWLSCGIASEVITRAVTELPVGSLKVAPVRIGLQDAPAPTSSALEKDYYPTVEKVVSAAIDMVNRKK